MAGQLTIDTLKASSGVLATQNGMTGIAKAWVNFSCPSGTVTIQNSFNISSVTQTATGFYVFSFTTAMPNATYSVIGTVSPDTGTYQCFTNAYSVSGSNYQAPTTTGFTAEVCRYNGTRANCNYNGYVVLSS
jgi:hypothetical protein